MISNVVLKYMYKNLSFRNIIEFLLIYFFYFVVDFDSDRFDFESSYNAVRNVFMFIAVIIGIVVGLIIFVIVVFIVVVCCCCMRSK